MKPEFFKCEECGRYFDSWQVPENDSNEADGITLDEVQFRYGSDGWNQAPDGLCGCKDYGEVTMMHVDYVLSIVELPQECIDDCSAQGSVDDAVEYWVGKLGFTVDVERARRCLKGYGAWDADELADETQNAQRILWLACGTFHDFQAGGADAGSDIFVLE